MTTFPARVIAEYERTGNEIIGRALEKAGWDYANCHDKQRRWFGRGGWVTPDEATETDTQSLAYCLLMELRNIDPGLAQRWLLIDDGEHELLAACIEAGRSE